jgi:hypothetical protein
MEDVMLPSAAEPAQTCSTYTEIDIRPLRQQWNSGNGYCGEMSVRGGGAPGEPAGCALAPCVAAASCNCVPPLPRQLTAGPLLASGCHPRTPVTQLQMSALARGIYISQKTARQLGVAAGANHPDLLFDERIQPASQMSGACACSCVRQLNGMPCTRHHGAGGCVLVRLCCLLPPHVLRRWLARCITHKRTQASTAWPRCWVWPSRPRATGIRTT